MDTPKLEPKDQTEILADGLRLLPALKTMSKIGEPFATLLSVVTLAYVLLRRNSLISDEAMLQNVAENHGRVGAAALEETLRALDKLDSLVLPVKP
jgi:hypothetical protein